MVSCDLMDGRDAFLTLAREKHYEFSSLRRAKYSTMCMLCELHNQGQDRFVYTCNECKHHVETRYHCTVCDVSLYFCVFYIQKSVGRNSSHVLGVSFVELICGISEARSYPEMLTCLSVGLPYFCLFIGTIQCYCYDNVTVSCATALLLSCDKFFNWGIPIQWILLLIDSTSARYYVWFLISNSA